MLFLLFLAALLTIQASKSDEIHVGSDKWKQITKGLQKWSSFERAPVNTPTIIDQKTHIKCVWLSIDDSRNIVRSRLAKSG